ncbi:peptidylprolyl isomerase [bacterium endosymbiont of Pedicinus badii]|uniref:peptidylprolyl isomerase n=1 Tax=bacterium endosymbiont of Pedicinus badii TaxID=1719126 RepID=UPI0009BB1C56|nr:peptidylprolyl isomerase [bacterium endosymbiont of Pedicinus badii]OQM34209.1 hypothetical protein AOQ89_02655 [bacterium endosymbiont of Pedicinus badii]
MSYSVFCNTEVLDEIVAIVNQEAILKSSITQKKEFSEKDDKEILEEIILEKIVLQNAKIFDFFVEKKIVEEKIEEILESNNLHKEKFIKILLENGIKYEDYFEKIKNKILFEQMEYYFTYPKIIIYPEEIESVLNNIMSSNIFENYRINISHFFYPFDDKEDSEKLYHLKKQLEEKIHSYEMNEKFDEFFSNFPGFLKITDQKSGWKIEDIFKKFLGELLKNAKKNSIIGPIFLSKSMHIFKVNEKKKINIPIDISQVRIQEIFLKYKNSKEKTQSIKKLKKILREVNRKKDSFTKIAKKKLNDSSFKEQGGDIGWKYIRFFNKEYLENIKKIYKKNKISNIFCTNSGCYIIKLIDFIENRRNNDLEKKSHDMIFRKRYSEEKSEWIKEIEKQSYVEIFKK